MKINFAVTASAAVFCVLSARPVIADDNADAFKMLDVDNNGYITAEEALEHARLPYVFAEADENEDGLLDLIEFGKYEITDE